MANAHSMLAGQTAVVTGASSGIGRAVTGLLLEAGVRVALVGRDEARLRAAAAGAKPGSTLTLACDVRDDASVQAMTARVEEAWGGADMLINSAGVYYVATLPDTTNEMWDDLWRTNVNGTFFVTRALLPGMLERGRGTIVVLSSVAAHRGFGSMSGYSATKYAVTGFARALTTEVRRKGVRVVNVAPGPVDTPLWDDHDTPLARDEMLTRAEVAQAIMSAMTVSETQVLEDVLLLPQKGIYF